MNLYPTIISFHIAMPRLQSGMITYLENLATSFHGFLPYILSPIDLDEAVTTTNSRIAAACQSYARHPLVEC